jgi:hypothetical protein
MDSQRAAKRFREDRSTVETFEEIGRKIMNRSAGGSSLTEDRRFREHFGSTSEICAHVWDNLLEHEFLPVGSRKEHVLWALMLLKQYSEPESVHCSRVGGVDEKTWRKYAWDFVDEIAALESKVVSNTLS